MSSWRNCRKQRTLRVPQHDVLPKNPSLRFSLWFSRHSFVVDFANSHGLNIYFLRNLISMACGEHRAEKPANPFQFTRFAIPVCVILRWKDLTQKCVKINGIVLLLFFRKEVSRVQLRIKLLFSWRLHLFYRSYFDGICKWRVGEFNALLLWCP